MSATSINLSGACQGDRSRLQELAHADNLTAAQNVFLGREIKKGFWPIRILDKQAMIDRSAALFKELKSETRPRDLVRKMSAGSARPWRLRRPGFQTPSWC